jgi:CRISPR-associated endonuclease Cas2
MALYLIAYDLRKPDFDYADLDSKLEQLGAKRVQESVWMLRSNESAKALQNQLKGSIHKKDRLLVAEVHSWASRKAMTKIKEI